MRVYKGISTFATKYIKKIEPCCGEAEDLFGSEGISNLGTEIVEDTNGDYITYTDWSHEYGNKYKIEFRYCPFCGEQIFIV